MCLEANHLAVSVSIGDLYFIQKLNLPAANHSDTENITLHDLENALSILVASMLWTVGDIIPSYIYGPDMGFVFMNGTTSAFLNDIPMSPILVHGIADISEIFVETQLELSIIAFSASLVVSIVLMAVASPLLRGSKFDEALPIDGTGILHAIRLFRNQEFEDNCARRKEENLKPSNVIAYLRPGNAPRRPSCDQSRVYGFPMGRAVIAVALYSVGSVSATSELIFVPQYAVPLQPVAATFRIG
ncbi:hypothetical protein C8R45DRAFT_929509 [Mycena sanguinolenta]|nr:hypothetical protein C8R45DRAFT_929509 [Mycena sanguinolenta]